MNGPGNERGAGEGAFAPDDTAAAMRLRAELSRVTRLSRRALATIGAIASFGIGGALIYALQTRHGGRSGEELYSTANRNTADGLAGLPRDYTGPRLGYTGPRLGPPLPGDLGRPILDAQNRGISVPVPAIRPPDPGISAEEQRRLQETEAARTAKLFAATETRGHGNPGQGTLGQGAANSPPNPLAMPDLSGTNLANLGLAPQPATPMAQERQLAFLNTPTDKRTVSPDRVAAPASPNILQAGAVIPAALITGIRSDLPGQITAQVTENIHDSPTGRILLIPQGARLIGQYDNGVGFGQRRVLLVWSRLIMPNGRSIVLERQPGADAQGYAGIEDGVDYHWWDLAKAAGLSTLLSIGSELAISDENRLLRAIRGGAQDTINDAGQQIIRRQLNVAPTLTIRPGFPVRVIVTRDLVLESYAN